jgi:hypothetical protein
LSMSESIGIDSLLGERAMPKPYSIDLRGHSRPPAADRSPH